MKRRGFLKLFSTAPALAALPTIARDRERQPLMCTSDCPHRPERFGVDHRHNFKPIVGATHTHNLSIEAAPCECRQHPPKPGGWWSRNDASGEEGGQAG